ncbi:MAG: CAP domain-containing protein [Streptosporangiaceae bacterium]
MIALAAVTVVVLSGCGNGPGSSPVALDISDEPSASSSITTSESAEPDPADDPAADPAAKKKKKKAAPTPQATPTGVPSPKPTKTVRPRPSVPATPKPRPTTTAKPPVVVPAGGMTAIELKVLEITNAERAKAGCKAVRGDAKLALAARRHSTDMGVNVYFDHNSQDGTSPWERIRKAGYTAGAAENIAAGQATAAAVMDGWMKSPGHRANILNCKLKALGVGYYKGSKGYRTYWTQDFGTA